MAPDPAFIRKRSLLASASAILIVVAFVTAVSLLTWRAERERHVAYLQTLAAFGERSLDSFLSQTVSALAMLAEEVREHDEMGVPGASLERFQEFRKLFPALSALTLIRPDGQLMTSTTAKDQGRLPSFAAERDFQESMADFAHGRAFSITRPFVGRLSGQWLFSIRFAERDAAGRVLFVVAGAVPISRAQDFWSTGALAEGTSLGVVRDDGYLLARHPPPAGMSPDSLFGDRRAGSLYQHLREQGFPREGVVTGISSSTGKNNLTVFRRFEHFPLTFRASTPYSAVWSAWLAIVLPLYGVIAVFLFALIALNVWLARLRRDIEREREQRITDLAAANQELTRANRELDAFSYTVAHDLRAPVRALDGFAGILAEDHGERLEADGRNVLARIRAATRRMESLIEGLLSFARLSREEPKLREVDMRAMAEGVAAELRPAESRHLLVIGDLPACRADPDLMRQVWSNLLSNAFKYSRDAQHPRIDVGFADGAYFVRDNGIGFDMAHSANLFGVFSRLHGPDSFEGTGVGLAIAQRIVERHGGRIWAEAAPGMGATFRFSVAAAPPPATSQSDPAAPGPAAGTRKDAP